jgi:hypothetical protein
VRAVSTARACASSCDTQRARRRPRVATCSTRSIASWD